MATARKTAAATEPAKHSVVTDALQTLGTIIDERQKRDAIHLAVEPVIAAHRLVAGQHVGFVGLGEVGTCENPVGIVDPFLKYPILAGERFWLVVYPRQITSLRHVWEHPGFPSAVGDADLPHDYAEVLTAARTVIKTMPEDERWLRNYASMLGVELNELLDHAHGYLKYDSYWSEGSRFEGEYVPDEFWDHYQTYTGEIVPERQQGSFFSCSC